RSRSLRPTSRPPWRFSVKELTSTSPRSASSKASWRPRHHPFQLSALILHPGLAEPSPCERAVALAPTLLACTASDERRRQQPRGRAERARRAGGGRCPATAAGSVLSRLRGVGRGPGPVRARAAGT